MSVTRIPDSEVTAVDVTATPVNRSVSGYGSKLPTRYRLRIGSRWHRVYAICWSNVSTLYVIKNGAMHCLEIATQQRLEDARDASK